MKEFIAASAVLWCIACYWLGGQEIPGLKRGYKWIRRFCLPVGLFVGLLALGAVWYLAVLSCVLLGAALHLGYGTKVWLYAVTGIAMGAPALVLGHFMPMEIVVACVPAMVHFGLGLVSKLDNRFGWAFVALAMGWAIGVAYVYQVY